MFHEISTPARRDSGHERHPRLPHAHRPPPARWPRPAAQGHEQQGPGQAGAGQPAGGARPDALRRVRGGWQPHLIGGSPRRAGRAGPPARPVHSEPGRAAGPASRAAEVQSAQGKGVKGVVAW